MMHASPSYEPVPPTGRPLLASKTSCFPVSGLWRRRPPVGRALAGSVALLAALVWATPAEAQFGSPNRVMSQATPRVFLDCQLDRGGCPNDHFRTHITFVNWVRDRTDADVHVIITGTPAAGGGQSFTMDFIGLRDMAGRNDAMTYISHGADANQTTIDWVTHALSLGLMRYAVAMGQGRNFRLEYTGAPANGAAERGGGDVEPQSFLDRWNFWTFRFGLSGNLNIREARSDRRMNPQMQADRVTENWKVNLSSWANLRRERIQLSDGREIRNDTDSWRLSALVVRSVSDNISVGLDSRASNSVQNNFRARASAAPAIEWNYYPYMEATRRQLIAHYGIGVEYSDYYEETIFGEVSETLPQHRFALIYNQREQWGNAGIGFDASQYLHDTDLYSFGVQGNLNLRVLRGLELNLSAGGSRVADQIHIPGGTISDEDILLGRQQLPTGFDYQASVGFNYRWGSAFANVVNSRFPSSVRN